MVPRYGGERISSSKSAESVMHFVVGIKIHSEIDHLRFNGKASTVYWKQRVRFDACSGTKELISNRCPLYYVKALPVQKA